MAKPVVIALPDATEALLSGMGAGGGWIRRVWAYLGWLEDLHLGRRIRSWRYPCATPSRNENGLPAGKPLMCLVANQGLEPRTKGL